MELSQGIRERRSIRKYKSDAIPHEVVEKIIEDAAFAPSWKNSQSVRYTFIEDRASIDKIADSMVLGFEYNKNTLKNAPALMVVSYITKRAGYERDGSFSTPKCDGFEMFDAGTASQTFCLAAASHGIGTVIMGYFDEEPIMEMIGIPAGQKIGCLIAMGYADEEPAAPRRKNTADLLTYFSSSSED